VKARLVTLVCLPLALMVPPDGQTQAVLAGRVEDLKGRVVPNVSLRLLEPDMAGGTDRDGVFRVQLPREWGPGRSVTLLVRMDGYEVLRPWGGVLIIRIRSGEDLEKVVVAETRLVRMVNDTRELERLFALRARSREEREAGSEVTWLRDEADRLKISIPELLSLLKEWRGHAEQSQDLYKQGLAAWYDERYGDAIASLSEDVAAAERTISEADSLRRVMPYKYLLLGIAHAKQHQDSEAHYYYDKALALRPQFPAALRQKAFLYHDRGMFREAEDVYLRAIKGNPTDGLVYYNLVVLFREVTDWKRADSISTFWQSQRPDDRYARWLQAERYEQRQDFAAAAQLYRALLDRDTTDLASLLRLASVELEEARINGDPELVRHAIQRAEYALRQDSTLVEAYGLLGAAYANRGDLERATSYYLQALKYDSLLTFVYNNLALIAQQRGDYLGALQYTRRMLVIRKDLYGWWNLGYYMFLAGDLRGALAVYDSAYAVAPRSYGLFTLRAEVLIWMGETVEARQELDSARKYFGAPEAEIPSGWSLEVLPEFDSTEARRTVRFSSRNHHLSLMDFLAGLIDLSDNEIDGALRSYQAAAERLEAGSREDVEVVLKGINDVHRLRIDKPNAPGPHIALCVLYGWVGDVRRAQHHRGLYLTLGGRPTVVC